MTDFDIRTLDASDIDAVDRLMKANSATLGFLPHEALLSYFQKGWVLGAVCSDGSLAAYILFANRTRDVRVAHVCVCHELRGKGLARKLMERLATDSRSQGLLSLELHCRRDFDAHGMWGSLGFIPWGEKSGRASSGTTLTLWRRELAQSDQMQLIFDGAGHGEINVVMDAQVVFDLEASDDDGPAVPSKALLSDFLADELNLKITDERPESSSVFSGMESGELERRCSPLCLTDFEQRFLIVPIRPGYAVNIVDFMRSADDLYGGDPTRLLRPDNVYYRSARNFRNLTPPARILWYVSDDSLIAGFSHLDGVEIGPAKEIFRKHKKQGTLDHRAVVQIAKGDPEGEVMALSFSDTHPFPSRISLADIREIYSELRGGTQFSPMSIRTVSAEIFHEFFKRGHQEGTLP